MSGSRRKATSIADPKKSSSNRIPSNSGTRARKPTPPTGTTRMRTRAQAKAQRAASLERPGLRHDTHQDFFAIKDIVDEKFVNGKRHYKIDWKDDPKTGESISPTWVCRPFSQ